MMTVKITWSSGTEEVVTSEHASVDAYINERFGSAWADAQEAGITVVEVAEERLPPEDDDLAVVD